MPPTSSSAKRGAALAIGVATVGWVLAKKSRRSATDMVGTAADDDHSSEQ